MGRHGFETNHRATDAKTALTGVAPRNGKTWVRNKPQKFYNKKVLHTTSHEEVINACKDKAPLSAYSLYGQNEISQEISSPCNEQVVRKDGVNPVEQNMLDSNSSVQLENMVDNFTCEITIPLYIWANRNTSQDYKACIQQNGLQFGYIPLNDLKLYHGQEVIWKIYIPLLFCKYIN